MGKLGKLKRDLLKNSAVMDLLKQTRYIYVYHDMNGIRFARKFYNSLQNIGKSIIRRG